MKQNKIEEAYFNCLREMFTQSTPKGDFDKMLKNATINEFGQKVIPFEEYELEFDKFKKILNNTIEMYKFKGYIKKQFEELVYLGASPKIKY